MNTIKISLNIRLLRNIASTKNNPAKWLRTGTHQIRQDDKLNRFIEVIKQKINHYSKIVNSFWLLTYSLDTFCDQNELTLIANHLKDHVHPFDFIFLFFPQRELIELFPNFNSKNKIYSSKPGKLLSRFLPEDAIPKWDDPRWKDADNE